VKAGEIIVTPTPLSGTDERMNEDPLKVDFHRKSMEHTTFGNGHHKCPGAHLARTEIRVTLEEWLQRIPEFSVAPGTVLKFGGGIVGTVNGLPLVWDVATTKAVAG
jgi:camphor 5-monooxygenase